jgi:hypothetical protein
MRVKLIGVSDEPRKSESVDRGEQDRCRLIATPLTHIGEAVHQQCARRLNVDSPHLESVNSLKRQMTLREPAVEISANLEYPACPLCESDQLEFPFHLPLIDRAMQRPVRDRRTAKAARVFTTYKYCRTGGGALI